jgi:hypothetical protein
VGAANISKLIGTMWGLIIETVDQNCALEVKVDGDILLNKKEIILRVCDPVITSRILVKGIPPGSKTIEATLFVGDEVKHNSLTLSAEDASMDEVCAIEVIADLQASVFDSLRRIRAWERRFYRSHQCQCNGRHPNHEPVC